MIGRRSQGFAFRFHAQLSPVPPTQRIHELGHEPGRMVLGNKFVQSGRQQLYLLSVHLSKRHGRPSSPAFTISLHPWKTSRLLRQIQFPSPKPDDWAARVVHFLSVFYTAVSIK